jgi:hypothetical protein
VTLVLDSEAPSNLFNEGEWWVQIPSAAGGCCKFANTWSLCLTIIMKLTNTFVPKCDCYLQHFVNEFLLSEQSFIQQRPLIQTFTTPIFFQSKPRCYVLMNQKSDNDGSNLSVSFKFRRPEFFGTISDFNEVASDFCTLWTQQMFMVGCAPFEVCSWIRGWVLRSWQRHLYLRSRWMPIIWFCNLWLVYRDHINSSTDISPTFNTATSS